MQEPQKVVSDQETKGSRELEMPRLYGTQNGIEVKTSSFWDDMVNKRLFRMIKWILKIKFMELYRNKLGQIQEMDDPHLFWIKIQEYYMWWFSWFNQETY